MPGSLRIGAAWALVVPFLMLSRPTPSLLVVGAVVSVVGLGVRAWAAGFIDKGAQLATNGPYAHTRNPLYLGSFVIGIGVAVAGGHWVWPLAFALVFGVVYVPTMRREATELTARFGDPYREYAANVPTFSVRLSPYRSSTGKHAGRSEVSTSQAGDPRPGPSGGGFAWNRYRRYREWEAGLGVAAVIGVLVLKFALRG